MSSNSYDLWNSSIYNTTASPPPALGVQLETYPPYHQHQSINTRPFSDLMNENGFNNTILDKNTSNNNESSSEITVIIIVAMLFCFGWIPKMIYHHHLNNNNNFMPTASNAPLPLHSNYNFNDYNNDILNRSIVNIDSDSDDNDATIEFNNNYQRQLQQEERERYAYDWYNYDLSPTINRRRRRRFNRQRGLRRLAYNDEGDDALTTRHYSEEMIIRHLKLQKYSDLINQDNDNEESNIIIEEKCCSICLNEYEDADVVSKSYNDKCLHIFHKDCIVEWLLNHSDCPCCRHPYILPQNNNNTSSSSTSSSSSSARPRLVHNNTSTSTATRRRNNTENEIQIQMLREIMENEFRRTQQLRHQYHTTTITTSNDIIPTITWSPQNGITIGTTTNATTTTTDQRGRRRLSSSHQDNNTILNIPPNSNVIVHLIPNNSNSNQRITFQNPYPLIHGNNTSNNIRNSHIVHINNMDEEQSNNSSNTINITHHENPIVIQEDDEGGGRREYVDEENNNNVEEINDDDDGNESNNEEVRHADQNNNDDNDDAELVVDTDNDNSSN